MYEIGKIYIWQNQVGQYAHYNGTECTPVEPASWWRVNDDGRMLWAQLVDCYDGYPMCAERGDLRPKNPPPGERSINDLFKLPALC